jgi:general secretion pathway protein N
MRVRPLWWFAGLCLAALLWGVWLMPASPVLSRVDGVMLGSAPLQLARVEGRLWQGAARWRWQGMSGILRWRWERRGLTPGLRLDGSGDVLMSGWLGVSPRAVSLMEMNLAVPVAPFVVAMPNIQAEGSVSARDLTLRWNGQQAYGVSGRLGYTGGNLSWARGQSAQLPVLTGVLQQEGQAATLDVLSPEGTLLAQGRIENKVAVLRVYRAWPALLGVSQGGNPGDVVFEASQPLTE